VLRAWVFGSCLTAWGCGAAAEEPAKALEALSWLEGHWISESDAGRTEEIWTDAAGGLLVGVHRDVYASGKASFEFLRLAVQDGGVVYLAQPSGRPATAFPLVESGDRFAVFQNTEHDFPQRIVYRLEADGTLRARIEGRVNGEERSSEWRWARRGD
jgi:hypothetical protein